MIKITTPSPLPPATKNKAYTLTFAAKSGVGTYTWAVGTGALPTGIALASNGVLSGTPTVSGNFSFEVEVTDTHGTQAVTEYELAVEAAVEEVYPPLAPSPSSLVLTRIDVLANLPIINGYVSVPDIDSNLRVPIDSALAVIPGATIGRYLGRLFLVLPQFERTAGYPSDWYSALRAAGTVQ